MKLYFNCAFPDYHVALDVSVGAVIRFGNDRSHPVALPRSDFVYLAQTEGQIKILAADRIEITYFNFNNNPSAAVSGPQTLGLPAFLEVGPYRFEIGIKSK